ncbi:MAG: SDR family NAD(P)-dependent oxidoreductase [Deltaproteobacteria bacterium]|nr:SDR family NAD(P)-dependent oxidoreductase [Deltaproteobacteria bacterium]
MSGAECLRGQRILITGASMGIGAAVARAFARQGAELLLVARSEEKLKNLLSEISADSPGSAYLTADLTQPEDVENLVQRLLLEGRLDGVVHNAGAGNYNTFAAVSEHELRELFELNFFSVFTLTRGLLPLLKRSPRATVLTVSSIVAWRAIPRMSVYSATKAALSAFAESLRIDLAPDGIRVVDVYPGRTRTDFTANAKSEGWKPFSTESEGATPERVAARILRAYVKGKRDEFVSFSNRLLIWGNFLFPSVIDWSMKRYFRGK